MDGLVQITHKNHVFNNTASICCFSGVYDYFNKCPKISQLLITIIIGG